MAEKEGNGGWIDTQDSWKLLLECETMMARPRRKNMYVVGVRIEDINEPGE